MSGSPPGVIADDVREPHSGYSSDSTILTLYIDMTDKMPVAVPKNSIRFACDRGGTFTDCFA